MNGMNKLIVGAIFGIGLVYIAICFGWSVYQEYLTGNYEMIILLPSSLTVDDLFRDIGYAALIDQYILAPIGQQLPAEIVPYSKYIVMAFTAMGFLLVVLGGFNRVARDMSSGEDQPKEKLFTHRRYAFLRMLALPWNSFLATAKVNVLLVIPLVLVLPFALPFALLADILMIIPFLLFRLVIGSKMSAASARDEEAYARNTEYAVCPKCKRNFVRPLVRCKCGRIMDYPVPDGYGYLYHTCDRGHDMPCTAAGGKRGLLNTLCPYCESEIVTHEARPIVVATVGAPSSGKTGLMLFALRAMDDASRKIGIEMDPHTPGVDRNRMGVAETSPKTEPGEHDSEIVFLKSPVFWEKELVFNDISGLEYEPKEDKVLFEEYFTYTDGFMFTIDGSALVSDFEGRTPPMDTFSTFMSMYRDVTGTGPSNVSTVPLAVVVTKTDLQKVKDKIRPSRSAESDTAVRELLVKGGQEGFVKTVESVFSNVRYYATGKGSDSAFMPLRWILCSADQDMASVFGGK